MKTHTVDLSKWVQYKETSSYLVYLEKDPANEITRNMLVINKSNNRGIVCSANKALFQLLFHPEQFKKEYMNLERGER